MHKKDKKINRAIKPKDNRSCSDCGASLSFHARHHSSIISEYFLCSNDTCGKKIPINRCSGNKKLSKRQAAKKKMKEEGFFRSLKEDNINIREVYEVDLTKFDDRFYPIEKKKSYNPISKTLRVGKKETQATGAQHEELTDIISKYE